MSASAKKVVAVKPRILCIGCDDASLEVIRPMVREAMEMRTLSFLDTTGLHRVAYPCLYFSGKNS